MKYLLVLTVCIHLFSHAQELHTVPSQEQLDKMEYEELLEVFNEFEFDSIPAEKIARTYLNRARKDGDTIKMARGYDRLGLIYNPKQNIQFADSIIELTKNLDHITYPGQGFILKAFWLMQLDDIKSSYENNIIALKYAQDRKNISQQIYIIDRLVFMQNSWGSSKKALNLQKKRDSIINTPNYRSEVLKSTRESYKRNIDQIILTNRIISCHSFAYCYLKSENIDSARVYIDKSFELLDDYSGKYKSQYENWTYDILMEYYYLKNDFTNSISVGYDIFKRFENLPSDYKEFNVNLFLGLSYMKLDSIEIGYNHLHKSDSIAEFGTPEVMPQYNRMLFSGLHNYYKLKKELKSQIKYLDKIISIDSVLRENYMFFEPNHILKFETPQILGQKEKLISDLKSSNKKTSTINNWVISCLIGSLIILGYYIHRQRLYSKRFKTLLSEKSNNKSGISEKAISSSLNEISLTNIQSILESLSDFESQRGYLNKKISLNTLAKKIDTNPNYLSRVVNIQKEKNFSQYLHELRINYVLDEILSNPHYRKFTIKAIAEECGYSNGDSFSKAFRRKTGIYPSYYIKKLDKIENTNGGG